ncbi:MAG: PQQ-binding-like beta-propeller repeat protein, partial [Planctomycetes bacterium]|nr:PQQ-binding-like beta-propeller repeat protein [Planctomycetota bacterium]
VQALDPDAERVEAARRRLRALGVYGPVPVRRLEGARLPYVDNLATVVIETRPVGVGRGEILRVLRPLGVLCAREDGRWTRIEKPWPEGMDDWPQHFYGPDNNAVSRDRLVGPPRRLQWRAEPEWMRSHMTMPSITSMVSAKGRVFTIEDRAPAEHPALPGEFALVARDGFNGIVLWVHPFPDWHPVNIRTKLTPVQLQRRLAAVGERVYCTPGFTAPITLLDAADGKVRKTYPETKRTTEFVVDGQTLFVVVGDPTDTQGLQGPGGLGTSQFPVRAYGPRPKVGPEPKSVILAIDAGSGRTLWRVGGDQTRRYQGDSLAVRGQNVVFATAGELVCLDRQTGRRRWRVPAPTVLQARFDTGGAGVALVLSDRAAYLADSKTVRAFSLEDGALLWKGKAILNHHKPADLFLAAGLVWSAYYDGHDPITGRIVKTLKQKMTGPMGHDRCYRNRITERYYVNTKTGGSDFLDLKTSAEFPNPWVRSTCGIGPMPANGLWYVGPPACSCCNWVMLNAMNALAPEPGLKTSGEVPKVPRKVRLQKGPAYGEAPGPDARPDDWPTYRHDPGRTGVTRATVPPDLAPVWEARLLARPSAPVVAAGRVFVAEVDAHSVCAFDAADGRLLWRFTTEGRVDSPPTYHRGLLLFGSHDGWVYAVRAADGALAWRFRDLPERILCAYEQPESAWPVCGSVLVRDGLAYFAAGRNSFLDGGIVIYALQAETGRLVHRRRMYGPYDAEGHPIITSRLTWGSGIDGFKNDVFLEAGGLLFLRQQGFRPDLVPLRPDEPRPPHLIPSPGFLEPIPHHRTFWTIDTTIRYDIQAGHQAAHGDILVLDGDRFYEVRGYTPGRIAPFDPRPTGYTLFAGRFVWKGEGPSRPRTKTKTTATPGRTTAGPSSLAAADPGAAHTRGRSGTGGAASKRDRAASRRKTRARSHRVASVAETRWTASIPLTGRALVLAGKTVFVAGTPVVFPPDNLAKAYEGRMGGVLWAVSAETGVKQGHRRLDAPPVWDGMAAAGGRLFVTLTDGRLLCFGANK